MDAADGLLLSPIGFFSTLPRTIQRLPPPHPTILSGTLVASRLSVEQEHRRAFCEGWFGAVDRIAKTRRSPRGKEKYHVGDHPTRRLDIAASGRIANLAPQPGLGLLPEWRAWVDPLDIDCADALWPDVADQWYGGTSRT